MKKISVFVMSFLIILSASHLFADGCYICSGKSGTYVKFTGEDTFDKRKKAKACGCDVGGTTSSCGAANYTILCTVSFLDQGQDKGKSVQICKKDK